MKVALVHDYLREYGGAERVVEALHEMYPNAPLYTSFVDKKALGLHWKNFANWKIYESWLSKIPFHTKLFSPLRIFSPQYFRSFDLSEYDLVISSSNAYFAKAVHVKPPAIHICYCHTPARSLYGYSTMTDWESKPLIHVVGALINHYLRVVDVKVAQDVPFFVANSREVQERIKKFYRRDSIVIHPPVRVPATLAPANPQYFLYVNRLAFAKHPELAVQACTQLGVPLKVVGSGKMEESLKALAGPTVEFFGSVNDQKLDELYAGAKALIYPVEDEDFGIVPVEAMAHGVPVLAHRSGGPRETILEKKTGLFFDELMVDAVIQAIKKFETEQFDRQKIYEHAKQFRAEKFKQDFMEYVSTLQTQQS